MLRLIILSLFSGHSFSFTVNNSKYCNLFLTPTTVHFLALPKSFTDSWFLTADLCCWVKLCIWEFVLFCIHALKIYDDYNHLWSYHMFTRCFCLNFIPISNSLTTFCNSRLAERCDYHQMKNVHLEGLFDLSNVTSS